jgi:hypothetical protein
MTIMTGYTLSMRTTFYAPYSGVRWSNMPSTKPTAQDSITYLEYTRLTMFGITSVSPLVN